jgi:hypothetical protein
MTGIRWRGGLLWWRSRILKGVINNDVNLTKLEF